MRKLLIAIAVLIGCALYGASPSLATNCGTGSGTCFVIAVGGNSNSSATWSNTTNGTGGVGPPIAGDQCILDSPAGNLTINAALACRSIDASGTGGSGSPYTHTLNCNGQSITLNGGAGNAVILNLPSNMTLSGSCTANLSDAASETVTITITAAIPANWNIVLGSTGASFTTFQLTASGINNVSTNAVTTLTLTSGTLDKTTNSAPIYIGEFSSNNGNNRTLNCGTGGWTLAGVGAIVWNIQTTTGLTISCGSDTINISNSAPTARRLFYQGAANTVYGTLNITAPSSGNSDVAIGCNGTSFTITTLQVPAGTMLDLCGSNGLTFTITNNLTLTGTSAKPIMVLGNYGGTSGIFKIGASGTGTVNLSYVMACSVTWTVNASGNTFGGWDICGNTNQTWTAPSAGGGIIGGGL